MITESRIRLLLLLIFCGALAVRLATVSLGTDVDTASILLRGVAVAEGKVLYEDIYSNKPPVKFMLSSWLFQAFPTHFVLASKVLMALLSASCVLAVYWIGRRFFGAIAGLAGAALLAFDPLSVMYARELHSSTLDAFFATWSVALLLWGMTARQRWAPLCLLAGACLGAGLMSKQSLVAMFPVLGLMLLFMDREARWTLNWRPNLPRVALFCLGCVAAILLIVAPQPFSVREMWQNLFGLNLELRQAGQGVSHIGGPVIKGVYLLRTAWTTQWLATFAAAGLLLALWRRDRRMLTPLMWLAGQAMFLFVLHYQAADHYLLPWAPAVAIVAGFGAAALLSAGLPLLYRLRSRLVPSAGAAAACLIALGLVAALLALAEYRLAAAVFAVWKAAPIATSLRALASTMAVLGAGLTAAIALALMTRRALPGPVRALGGLVLALGLFGALLPFWTRRATYPEPFIRTSMETDMAQWVRSRLQPGEDVAVVGNPIMTLYGGWRDLPARWRGRTQCNPRAIGDSLREHSPDPIMQRDTIALWNRDYNVRFLVTFLEYYDLRSRPDCEPFRDYVDKNFVLLKHFAWGTTDYAGQVLVFERKDFHRTTDDFTGGR